MGVCLRPLLESGSVSVGDRLNLGRAAGLHLFGAGFFVVRGIGNNRKDGLEDVRS
jgi:hypothetical protein